MNSFSLEDGCPSPIITLYFLKNPFSESVIEMVKVKPMEKIVANYVLSTVRGVFNTAQHWIEEGYSVDHAIDNAWRYGLGMLRSGVGETVDWETAANHFRQLGTIANILADRCGETASKIRENQTLSLFHISSFCSDNLSQSFSEIMCHLWSFYELVHQLILEFHCFNIQRKRAPLAIFRIG